MTKLTATDSRLRSLEVFCCVLALCAGALAQGGGWAAVQRISPGSGVEVRTRSATVKGEFAGASASGVDLLTAGGSTRHMDRDGIKSLWLMRRSRWVRDALVGAGIGAAGGAVFGAAHTQCYPLEQGGCLRGLAAAGFAVMGGAIGAVVVTVVRWVKGPPRTLIYESNSDARHGASARPKDAVAAGIGR